MLWIWMGCTGAETDIQSLEPDLALSVESIDFGAQKIEEEWQQSIQLINAGRAKLHIESMEIEGDDGAVFSVVEYAPEVAVDAVSDVLLSFTPVALESYQAQLVIKSNDPNFPEYRVDVVGVGGLGPLPDIALSVDNLDFGSVPTGEESLLFVNIRNEGDAMLQIGETTQQGSGAFTLLTDVDGQQIPPGAETSVLVQYVPFQGGGDRGELQIASNDPDEPMVSLVLQGNGGAEFEYPVANLVCPTDIQIPSSVVVDGSSSLDPNGEELTYHWSLLQTPTGSQSSISSTTGSSFVWVPVDVAGRYRVGLTVENASGVPSAQSECNWEATPPDDIYVELSWQDRHADMDLHLLTDSEGLFGFATDCCWCNTSPQWNSVEDTNPVLLMDSEDGSNPEVVAVTTGVEGEYFVRVHYFADNGGGSTEATLRVFVQGQLAGQYTMALEHNQIWNVGFVRWPMAVFAEELDAPMDFAGSRACH